MPVLRSWLEMNLDIWLWMLLLVPLLISFMMLNWFKLLIGNVWGKRFWEWMVSFFSLSPPSPSWFGLWMVANRLACFGGK